MTITLIRHAKVDFVYKKIYSHIEFDRACNTYDRSPIHTARNKKNYDSAEVIYISSLPRTRDTARLILPNREYIENEIFNESSIRSFASLPFPLPTALWFLFGRLQWLFGFQRQPETQQQTKRRAKQAADILESDKGKESVLLISHGMFLRVLVKELKSRGYLLTNTARYRNLDEIRLYKS